MYRTTSIHFYSRVNVLFAPGLFVWLLYLCVLPGCGGGGSSGKEYAQWGGMTKEQYLEKRRQKMQEEQAAEKTEAEQTSANKQPSAAAAPKPAPPPRPRTSMEDDNEEAPAAPPAPPKPTRPKNVADWKRDDYLSAKRDGDVRLIEAVTHLGRNHAGKKSAAQLLAQLLESDANVGGDDEEDLPGKRRPTKPLIEAVAAALAANNTPTAWNAIRDMAAGKLTGGDSKTATQIALRIIAEHPNPKNEGFLLTLLTSKNIADQQSEKDTFKKALESLQTVASEQFRLQLAERAIVPDISPVICDAVIEQLSKPDFRNIPAQIYFYSQTNSDDQTRLKIEQILLDRSSAVTAAMLGLPPLKSMSEEQISGEATDWACRLWGEPMAIAVQRRLAKIDSLHKGSNIIALAAGLPMDTVRESLHRTLRRYWDEGPEGLQTNRFSEDLVFEPGFLAIVKMLPRGEAMIGLSTQRNVGGSPKNTRLASTLEARQRQQEIGQQWLRLSEQLVFAVCQRLYTAAPAVGKPDVQLPTDFMPKPHPDSRLATVYSRRWPPAVIKSDAITPLMVHYLRLEHRAKPVTLLAYYRRQLKEYQERPVENGVWLDSIEPESKGLAGRSVDVLITKTAKQAVAVGNQELELTVDILVLEGLPSKE